MEDNGKKSNWGTAIEIFSQVSSWIIGPIVLALIFGKILDKHYGTSPWVFLGLTGVAFIISIYGIVRVVSNYMKNLDKK